jgi:hypothetical protein
MTQFLIRLARGVTGPAIESEVTADSGSAAGATAEATVRSRSSGAQITSLNKFKFIRIYE